MRQFVSQKEEKVDVTLSRMRVGLFYLFLTGCVLSIILTFGRDFPDHRELLPLLLGFSFLVIGELARLLVLAVSRSTSGAYNLAICGGVSLSLVLGAAITIVTDFSFAHTVSVIQIISLAAGLLAYIASMIMLISRWSKRL